MEDTPPELLSLQQEAVDEKTSSDRLFELTKLSVELAQLVAKNPCTPPDLLRELGASRDYTTRKNVAANPNTPTEVLLKLGAKFPEQLLDNPIFSLLLLENPNLIEEIPRTTLLSLLKCETVPASFLEWAANKRDRDAHIALAMNARTSGAVLETLVGSEYAEVSELARLHVNWAGEMTQSWNEVVKEVIQTTALSYNYNGRENAENLAYRGLIPNFALEQLARHKNKVIRSLVADNPNTPVKLLEQLVRDEDKYIRTFVADNPNIQVKLLEQLARDEDILVRESVARNRKTPTQLLEQLARDEEKFVRESVARNRKTPTQLLEQLARDEEKQVCTSVARNPNTPVNLLERFAEDEDKQVRSFVAQNPSTPVKLLEQLAQDEDKQVRSSVAQNPSTPVKLLEQLTQDKDKQVRSCVAQNPNIAIELLEQLIQADYKTVRKSVAQNPNTPVELLERLAQDKDKYVRSFAASNPNTPVELLERLVQDEDKYVRSFAASNPNTPVNLFLEAMLKDDAPNYTPSLVRFLVLLHPQTPEFALAENVRSLAWLERYAIAQNPNTPLDTLKALAKDANRIVRAAAKANARKSQPIAII